MIAFIDIDGVVADSTERFKWAQEALQAHKLAWDGSQNVREWDKKGWEVYWATAFNPKLVALDALIAGASQMIDEIEAKGYTIIFLTSRPDSMYMATIRWFDRYDLFTNSRILICKPAVFQYTKTPVWKIGTIQQTAHLIKEQRQSWDALKPFHVLVVDDELEALKAASPVTKDWLMAASLTEALDLLK